jgi:hypothetical protein
MHINDPIVARSHVICASAGVSDRRKDARSQRIHTVIDPTVVRSICKGRDIKTVGLELLCLAVPVAVTGRYNGPGVIITRGPTGVGVATAWDASKAVASGRGLQRSGFRAWKAV